MKWVPEKPVLELTLTEDTGSRGCVDQGLKTVVQDFPALSLLVPVYQLWSAPAPSLMRASLLFPAVSVSLEPSKQLNETSYLHSYVFWRGFHSIKWFIYVFHGYENNSGAWVTTVTGISSSSLSKSHPHKEWSMPVLKVSLYQHNRVENRSAFQIFKSPVVVPSVEGFHLLTPVGTLLLKEPVCRQRDNTKETS